MIKVYCLEIPIKVGCYLALFIMLLVMSTGILIFSIWLMAPMQVSATSIIRIGVFFSLKKHNLICLKYNFQKIHKTRF